MSGANTYQGTTTVNAGTLIINGDQSAATGIVTVSVGATLGGSGTAGGSTTGQLNWTPVPETSSALAGLLLSAGLLRRGRRQAGT